MKRISILCILALAAPFARAQSVQPVNNPAVVVTVDAQAARHGINDLVYGVCDADQLTLQDLHFALNRRGGNAASRYNWNLNADNRGAGNFFESVGYVSPTPGAEVINFVSATHEALAEPMVTIPTLDWVAKLGPNRAKSASFRVSVYGTQQATDPSFTDAGNGVRTDGSFVTGNNPNDASTPNDSTSAQGLVQLLQSWFGTASNGGVHYYTLDNEPSKWYVTHRDVHPTGASMEEVRDKTADFATKIKAVEPGAVVVGPEEWGWNGYFYSGFDQQFGASHDWLIFPDREAHNDADYLPWFLDQMRQRSQTAGRRLLDVCSVHYYPSGGEYSTDVSTTMQLKRNRSTRSLWDPNYVDESPIGTQVKLIPRLKEWVSSNYPGTSVALTEYNWGAANHMNGATAEADVLGILGREGVDMACYSTTPAPGSPVYYALKMYRNYDGGRSTFGNVSVAATGFDADTLSAFAAQRTSDGALTVMVVNKALSGNTPVTVNYSNFTGTGVAQVWQLASAATGIQRLSDIGVPGTSVATTVPPQSVTLFVLPAPPPGDTPGIYVSGSGAWFLRNTNTAGAADTAFTFGPGGSSVVPIVGDWNGDGSTTPGLYNPTTGAFFLKNSNFGGPADVVFTFGAANAGLVPIVGDWDGDGDDSVGLYDPVHSTFFLKNTNAGGAADIVFGFGPAGAGWKPLAGDWNNDLDDSVGLYNPATGTFFLKNLNGPGGADIAFAYGPPGATPITGDWNGDGTDTVGVYVPATGAWFLRAANAPGPADLVFSYGPPNVTPIVGDWDGL
jgi:hypothetical protein